MPRGIVGVAKETFEQECPNPVKYFKKKIIIIESRNN